MSGAVFLAWLVHLYSALGAVIAFFAILRIEQRDFATAFWLMALAVAIDATDGTLARLARVKETIRSFDGDRLEDIIDYANYVIVPCLFFLRADLLPQPDAALIAALPLIASAYGFCQKEAKTADHYFLGFPSYWNLVAFYLYALQTPPWANAFIIIVLCILVFVPIRYVYPSRSTHYRALTNGLALVWAIMIGWVLYTLPQPPRALALASLFYPVYYVFLSLYLNWRREPFAATTRRAP